MVTLSDAEYDLIEDLLDCIAEAIAAVDDIDSKYANKTKLQKLLYLAIDEYDLPVTYSWYLAGAVLPDDAATPQTLETAFDRVDTPDAPSISEPDKSELSHSESDSPTDESAAIDTGGDDDPLEPALFSDFSIDEFSAPSVSDESTNKPRSDATIDGHPREDIVDFYTAELPTVWHQNTMQFLQNFYLEHAPADYQDLYVQSTHIRIRLRDIVEAVDAHLDGTTPETSISHLADNVGLDISDLHMTIQGSDILQPTFDGVVAGTDIIEGALMMLSQTDPSELTTDHLEAMQTIEDFYYYYVWRYPCLIISQETVTGPSADAVRTARQERLTDFESVLRNKISELEAQLSAVGLCPSYTDYPSENDAVGETISDLTNQYLQQ